MEIAISSLIVLFLLLPGISFNRGYYSGEFSIRYLKTDFFTLLIGTLVQSICIYVFGYFLTSCLGFTYDFKTLLGILSSNEELVKESIEKIDRYIEEIATFHIITNSISYLSGKLLRNIILTYGLDIKFRHLQFQNIWYYITTGKYLEIHDILQIDRAEDADLTFVDALIKINDQTFIYTGILLDFELGKDGTIDFITITKAQRKLVTGNDSGSYKDIKGNLLVLKYSDLLNINYSFIQLEEEYDDNGEITSITTRLIK